MIAHPFIYEINTWPWLDELSRRCGRRVELGDVPGEAWDAIAACGADAVWLMGVWQRSPAGVAIARADETLVQHCRDILPDFTIDDIVGSPYCIRGYEVDPMLGGTDGLASARQALADRGIRLILDFVPNHVAPDHSWTTAHPEFFVGGTADDLREEPASFLEVGGKVLANGRDPYFPAWPDVVQLNAFSTELRAAVITTLTRIAEQCDGVRCDMAMLMMNDVFGRTWGVRAGDLPAQEYWPLVIGAVRSVHPDFTFIAEAYWDLEAALQEQGFDYCYDKGLYDRLVEGGDAAAVRSRLDAESDHLSRLVRFLENHDEPRAASVLSLEKHKIAAVTSFTQPGARLVYDGQFEGRRVHLPVQLGRSPVEEVDNELLDFYGRLMKTVRDNVFRTGSWATAEITGWADNSTTADLLAWTWHGDTRWVVVVNLGDQVASGMVRAAWDAPGALDPQHVAPVDEVDLVDDTRDLRYRRSAADLTEGLFVELGPRLWHLFRVEPVPAEDTTDDAEREAI
ncbi:alpha-amylase family glycosyl hydrolase [Williamsia muralis]|uniref:Alpha-amylase n=1 Tax=Williamsia marianensis TaxID=85044 RepID=A0A2G3PTM9_WILMA|nr:alpha-amylase family glycosyl hydrolase [Williamsia marianensis]PHV68402.1 alpha-amylase [Williamsia marianensis]